MASQESLGRAVLRAAAVTAVGTAGSVIILYFVQRMIFPEFERMLNGVDSQHATTDDANLSAHEEIWAKCVVKPTTASVAVGYEDIGGLSVQLDDIRKSVLLPLSNGHLYKHSRLARRPTGLLLHGPPGTGKTLLAKVIARNAQASFINVSLGTIMNKYVGESEKMIESLFSCARKQKRAVIFIDECEGLFGHRRDSSENGGRYLGMMVNAFLACWDGLTDCPPGEEGTGAWVLVVGATNRPSALDPAIARRFSRQVVVPMPTVADRESILRVHLRSEVSSPEVDYHAIAVACAGLSGSDLREVTRIAAVKGIDAALMTAQDGSTQAPEPITTQSMLAAVREYKHTRRMGASLLPTAHVTPEEVDEETDARAPHGRPARRTGGQEVDNSTASVAAALHALQELLKGSGMRPEAAPTQTAVDVCVLAQGHAQACAACRQALGLDTALAPGCEPD